jgi:type I restriction enzyme S subunit
MSLIDLAEQDGRAWIRIGDCYAVTKKPRDLDIHSHSAIPFIPMESVPQGGAYQPSFVLKTPGTMSSGTYFELGDVLLAKITPSFENGKQALVRSLPLPFGYASTEVIPLRPIDSNKHDARLLFFYLLHPDVRHYVAERMEGSTGRQRVPESVLLDLPIPDIEFTEQARAADVLELIQTAMSVEADGMKNAQELKCAAMIRLITRGMRGEVQKEEEIGLMPASWEVVPFEEALAIAQGQVDPKTEPYASMLHIGPENVEPNSGHLLPCQRAKDLGLISGKYHFAHGDIVYSKIRPYLNKVVMPDFEGICSADMYPLRARAGFDARFLFHYLLSDFFLRQAVPHQLRTGIPKINREQLSDTSFPKPTLNEQREIVAILDAIDRKIVLHRQRRVVLQKLFHASLHKLMTGEIRVDDLDLSALTATPAQLVETTA